MSDDTLYTADAATLRARATILRELASDTQLVQEDRALLSGAAALEGLALMMERANAIATNYPDSTARWNPALWGGSLVYSITPDAEAWTPTPLAALANALSGDSLKAGK